MGMLTSMYSGVSGLNVHGKALSAVADNIANVNTVGFKYTRTNFSDIMVHSLTVGGAVVSQVGTGARISSVQNILTQGSFESTEVPTDMAINGRGYFQVVRPNNGSTYYTRAGQFLLDSEGYMVSPLGDRLQGYNIDENGDILAVPENIRILTQQTDAEDTNLVELSVNLDAEDENRHNYTQPIDPEDQSSWNYLTTTRTYDSLGVAHDLSLLYQRMELGGDPGAYPGNLPVDPSTGLPIDPQEAAVWKVSVFENEDGTFDQTNIDSYNTFYLVFDTDGHLVGSTSGAVATGDEYTSQAAVAATTSEVSDRVGEVLSFTPTNADGVADDPPGSQTFISSYDIGFGAGTTGDETVTVGTTTYTLSAGLTAAEAAQELTNLINAEPGTDYWATVTGTTVTINSSGTSRSISYDDTDGTALMTGTGRTLTEVRDAFLLGQNANMSMFIDDVTSFAAGTDMMDITIPGVGATTVTVPAGGWANWAAFVADLNTQLPAGITANYTEDPTTANQGTVVLTADGAGLTGTDGNDITITRDAGLAVTDLVLHGSNLSGGIDDRVVSTVEADIVTDTDGEHLVLRSVDTGYDAVVALSASNTLGGGLGLNFQTWSQDTFANDGQPSGTPSSDGEWDLTFNWLGASGATEPQTITFDFSPADTSTAASTQSAGSSETFYLYQDGSTRGSLQSLDIGRDGVITGQFSNSQLRVLGQVMIADFAAPDALMREGDNLWSQTILSGEPVLNEAGQGGRGRIEAGSLEMSNVDLASEFVKMINYQRAFQANSKVISTTDQMLAELIQLKR